MRLVRDFLTQLNYQVGKLSNMQKINYIAIDKLKSHPDNPRLIKGPQFEILCKSLEDNPDYFETRPILCNKEYVVFAGNMRLRAAKEIGLKEVPVAIMDISEERQRELMIRDNVQNGEWEMDVLANVFDDQELIDWGIDPVELGLDKTVAEDTNHNLNTCARCEELKRAIEGHHHRTGHVPSPLPVASPKTTPPPENSDEDERGGEKD